MRWLGRGFGEGHSYPRPQTETANLGVSRRNTFGPGLIAGFGHLFCGFAATKQLVTFGCRARLTVSGGFGAAETIGDSDRG